MWRITNTQIMKAKLSHLADGPDHRDWQLVQEMLANDVATAAKRLAQREGLSPKQPRAPIEYAVADGVASGVGAMHRCRDYATSQAYSRIYFLNGLRDGRRYRKAKQNYLALLSSELLLPPARKFLLEAANGSSGPSSPTESTLPFSLRCFTLAAVCERRMWIYWTLQNPREEHLGRLAEVALGKTTRQNNLTSSGVIDDFDQLAAEFVQAHEMASSGQGQEQPNWLLDLLAQWDACCQVQTKHDPNADTTLAALADFLNEQAPRLISQTELVRFPVASAAVLRLAELLLERSDHFKLLRLALSELLANIEPVAAEANQPPRAMSLYAWLELLPPDFPRIELPPADVLDEITRIPVPTPAPPDDLPEPETPGLEMELDRGLIRQEMQRSFSEGDLPHTLVKELILGRSFADLTSHLMLAAHNGSLPADLWPDLANRLQEWSDYLLGKQTNKYTDAWILIEIPSSAQEMPKRLEPLLQFAQDSADGQAPCGWAPSQWAPTEETILVAALRSVLLDELTNAFQAIYKAKKAAEMAKKQAIRKEKKAAEMAKKQARAEAARG